MTKKSKIAAVQTAFSFGGTINPPTTKYSASKGTCVVTAAILDFIIIFLPYPLHRTEFY